MADVAVSSFDPWYVRPATIRRTYHEAPGVNSYELQLDDVRRSFQFRPGQFNMLYVPGIGEAAISIAGQLSDQYCLRHTIRAAGAVNAAIEAGGTGMQLGLRGPFGSHWPIESLPSANKDLIIVAGGIGLAPLRSVIDVVMAQRNKFRNVNVLIGARRPEDLIYKHEFETWQSHEIMIETTVDRASEGWKGHVGVVTLLLERLAIPEPAHTLLMTCGPEVMMRYVARSAMDRGVGERNVWLTLERHFNCAIGLCGHCQLGPEFLCKDGPIFPFDRVKDWIRVQDL